jgi:hypothetical protein
VKLDTQPIDTPTVESPSPQQDRELTPDEPAKLDGTLGITDHGWVEADIYNGTQKPIGGLTVEVSVLNRAKSVSLTRQYRLSSTGGEPLASSKFIQEAGIRLTEGQTWEWRILSAQTRD